MLGVRLTESVSILVEAKRDRQREHPCLGQTYRYVITHFTVFVNPAQFVVYFYFLYLLGLLMILFLEPCVT